MMRLFPYRLMWMLVALMLWVGVVVPADAQTGREVLVLRYEGPVTPAMLAYLERGIQQAQERGAEALVFEMDTPGGSVTVMKLVLQAIQDSATPVIVYVAPARAWAASAGALITLAGHMAVMAPETFIGAASPVGSGGEELPDTARQKEMEALSATARSLAERRGERAVAWAAQTVLAAKASTAVEALAIGAIDAIAVDLPELLRLLDGRMVTVGGSERRLQLADAEVVELERSWVEILLATLSNPAVAAILLTLGLNALLYELSAPGGYVAGAVGVIALLLAFYSLGTLDANFAGLALVFVAFVLFVVELKVHTGGALTVGGLAAFVLGSVMLLDTPYAAIPWTTIIGLTAAMGLFVAFALRAVVQTQRRSPASGGSTLVGRRGEARSAMRPQGMVYVQGAWWSATAEEGEIAEGTAVVVTRRQGHHLWVKPVDR